MPEKLYSIKESAMVNMADTIRQITGTTGPITGEEIGNYVVTNLPNSENLDEVLEDQDDIIAQIQTALQGKAAGGSAEPVLQEKTVDPSTSSQTVKPDSGYDGLSQVTVNAMTTATQATPSISVSSSGLITASATQEAGYVSAGTKSNTKQLTTQAAKTVTPSTSSQTAVASGRYTTGAVTVAGDANLKAENIAEGVSIFGVTGTHSGGSSGGGVEVCSLSTGANHAANSSFVYCVYEDGQVVHKIVYVSSPNTLIADNVVKNSIIATGMYGTETEGLVLINEVSGVNYYIEGNAVFSNRPCFISETRILLNDNTSKKVQDITYQDNLLVWDFDNGCYTSAKPLWIKQEEVTSDYYHCIFDNGTTLDLVGSNGNCHAVYCLDDNCFEYANKCVGKMIMTQNGATKLLSCELKYETVKFYNIITDYHLNCYANGILTSTKLNNLYPIQNMKFIKEERNSISYNDMSDIPMEYYNGLRLSEQKQEDFDLIYEKVKNIIAKAKPKEVK